MPAPFSTILDGNGNPFTSTNPLQISLGRASTVGDSTIAVGGTAQTVFGGVVPDNGWKIFNPHPTEDLWVNDAGGVAAPNTGIRVFAGGGQYSTESGEKPAGPLSIYGATTGHAFGARKW